MSISLQDFLRQMSHARAAGALRQCPEQEPEARVPRSPGWVATSGWVEDMDDTILEYSIVKLVVINIVYIVHIQ